MLIISTYSSLKFSISTFSTSVLGLVEGVFIISNISVLRLVKAMISSPLEPLGVTVVVVNSVLADIISRPPSSTGFSSNFINVSNVFSLNLPPSRPLATTAINSIASFALTSVYMLKFSLSIVLISIATACISDCATFS